MPVQEINHKMFENENDKFPVGMRVLAVDDDMACLKILETMLRKCQYEVTTCNQAKVALELLRKNKNKFDIVISDVHMPDMDGMKFLEHMGLEMDLPVLMLSANSDPKMVMKGITHGACDYLLKPVRIEELRNIWQHIIRRKNRVLRVENNSEIENRKLKANTESRSGTNFGPNGERSSRKRKEGDEEGDEDGIDNHEPDAPKKPRVVSSIDLHRKFVDAVNQLGIHGKGAVPKKILEHMNVEGLSRENVASHLQKYRLYLKRISSVAAHSRAISFGGRDSCMRMSSYNGVGDLQPLTCNQGRHPKNAMSPYQTGPVLSRLNTPNTTLTKFNPSLLQQKPMDLNQLPSSTSTAPYNINLIGGSINNYFNSAQNEGIFGNQSLGIFNAITIPNSINNNVFSNLSSNSNSLSEALNCGPLVPSCIPENTSPPGCNILNNLYEFSSFNVMEMPNNDSRGEGLLDIFKNNNNMLPVNGVMGPFGQTLDQNNGLYHRTTDLPFQGSTSLSYMMQRDANEDVALEMKAKPNGDYLMEQWRSHSDNLDELLMSSTVKGEGGMIIDGDFGPNYYTF